MFTPRRIGILLFCALTTLTFSWPLLTRLRAEGIWDWSEAAATYESFRHAVLRHHQFLFWNPYICGGSPGLANPQTYFTSFAGLSALLTDSVAGPKLAVPLYLLFGSIGMLLLARRFSIPFPAALLVIPVFFMSGLMTSHIAAGQFLWLAIAYIPWVFYGYIMSTKSRWYLLLAASAMAMIGIEGRSYLIAYTAIGIGAYGLIIDITYRFRTHAILRAFLVILLAFLLGAFKFIPDLYFIQEKVRTLEETGNMGFSYVPTMFLNRDITPDKILSNGLAQVDFALYVGVLPLLLIAVALSHRSIRKHLAPLLFVGIGFFAIAVSDAKTNPLELFPILNELRNQQRGFVMVLFVAAFLSGFGLSKATNFIPFLRTKFSRSVIQLAVIAFVMADLSIISYPTFINGYPNLPDTSEPDTEFIDNSFLQTQGVVPFPVVHQHHGAAVFCPAILQAWHKPPSVTVAQDENYRGEVYVEGEGTAELVHFSPNRLVIRSNVTQGHIVVNQHAHNGWDAPFSTVSRTHDGLLMIYPPPGTQTLMLRYRPPGFILGLVVTLLTLGGVFVLWVRKYTSWRKPPKP